MTRENPSITQGVHHLGLTVPDLATARDFFTSVLLFEVVGEVADYPAVFLGDGSVMLTLWQAKNPATAIPFDREQVIGLHHFALGVADANALESVHKRIVEANGAQVEFAPEPLGAGPTRHMMCTIPGGIRLEIIAPASV